MGKFEVKFHRNAAKAYQRLPKAVKQRIDEAIETLRTNPFYGKDICKLSGKLEGLYRLRVGGYRVLSTASLKNNAWLSLKPLERGERCIERWECSPRRC
ncbi:type II toxin-antitoxin system RelE family toxin [Fervidibacter sacchari]